MLKAIGIGAAVLARPMPSTATVEPFEVRNTVDFTLEQQGDATRVTSSSTWIAWSARNSKPASRA